MTSAIGSSRASSEVVMVAIVAANGVIGDGTDQPWHLREDHRHFRALTMGRPVVMGRRTWESIGGPLVGRASVVLTRDRRWSAQEAHVAHDIDEAISIAAALPGGDQVMIIGGGQVYTEALPHADRVELTEVDAEAEGETHFPRLEPSQWVQTHRDDRFAMAFVTYRRRDEATDDQ
ncbi:Dihydrofolate reductase type 3 [Austwickia sp. TVS 96-490-7B]|uniref:dihydrofolate reductase n=1 Tax=Austwickia sp. TVS 96-490-7B TaxID=2830843 RepID=UPI001C562217|nr:dihydrofolate reductase [Austwickia sp. TVS 96-490-7B]MBW3086490.1 Dihydrofolate reductase type 3 [Austwickia sp. TVS 96-490-7B]